MHLTIEATLGCQGSKRLLVRFEAFAAVVKGMNCTDASKPFKLDQAKMAAVVETYRYLGIDDCSVKAFSPAVKDRAAKLLGGVTVTVQ